MKVSIIGAGLSGLACAHRLVQLGVTPRVFEKDPEVGAFFPVAEALLETFYRPVEDPLRELAQKYDIYLHPQQTITRMVLRSRQHEAVFEGFQGFTVMRGDHPDSIEKQMARQLEAPIEYGPTDLRRIARESDYVVVATGDPEMVSQVQPWYTDVTANLFVATVQGEFLPREACLWFSREFAPKGYAFMLPWDSGQATLSIAVPRQADQIAEYWRHFLSQLTFPVQVVDQKTVNNFQFGHIEKNQIGNLLFVGNAGGAPMPFMGFGIWDSLISGIWAAEAIVQKRDFNQVMRPMKRAYRRSLGLRRWFAGLEETGLDRLVRVLGTPVAQRLLIQSRLDLIKLAGVISSLRIHDT